MTTPLSDEVRTHADRTHRRKLTRAALAAEEAAR